VDIIAEVFEKKMNPERKLSLAFQTISWMPLLRISKLMSSFDPSPLSFNQAIKPWSLQHCKGSSRA